MLASESRALLVAFLLAALTGGTVSAAAGRRARSARSASEQRADAAPPPGEYAITWKWVRNSRYYLAQFVEPGTPLEGESVTVAGEKRRFRIDEDRKTVSIAKDSEGRFFTTVRTGGIVSLNVPLALARTISPAAPDRESERRPYVLFVRKDPAGTWRLYPLTVLRAKLRTWTITIVDLNLNGVYGEPWEDGIVVDPALPPWPMTGNALPPYLAAGRDRFSPAYRFPDTGPVQRQPAEMRWEWLYAAPFRARHPVEKAVLEFRPGDRPGATKVSVEPLAPNWEEARRLLLAAINRVRLLVGLPSTFATDRQDILQDARRHLEHVTRANKAGWKAATSATRGGGEFARMRCLITSGWAGGENQFRPEYAFLPEMDNQRRVVYLYPKTRAFAVAYVAEPYEAWAVNGLEDLDPECRWRNWPVIFPPPECRQYPWRTSTCRKMDDRPHYSAAPDVPEEIVLGARRTKSSHDFGTSLTLIFEEARPDVSNVECRMWEVPRFFTTEPKGRRGGRQAFPGERRGEREIVLWYFTPSSPSRKKDPGFAPGVDNGPNTRSIQGNDYHIRAYPNHRLKPNAFFRFHVAFDYGGRRWEKMWWAKTTPPGRFPYTGRTF